ncbi:MAG: hypothetical protein AAF556_00660 [Pseudomonadota bacterium]
MTAGPAFSQPMIAQIRAACPELTNYALIVDPFEHGDLLTAIAAVLDQASPDFAAKAQAQLDLVPADQMAGAKKLFAQANGFSMPLNLKPGELLPVNVLQPIQLVNDAFQASQFRTQRVTWHGDLGTDRDDAEIAEQAGRFMRQAAWHEAGHAVAYGRGYLRSLSLADLANSTKGPLTPTTDWQQTARRNMSEQLADGFSLRMVAMANRDEALTMAQELVDFRSVSIISSLMRGHPDHIHHFADPAINAAVAGMASGLMVGAEASDAAEATWKTYQAAPTTADDMTELGSLAQKLRTPTEFGDQAILFALAEAGRTAETKPTYLVTRNYADAMRRLLPADHPQWVPFGQVQEAIARHPKAALWDQQTPLVGARILATRVAMTRGNTVTPKPDLQPHTQPHKPPGAQSQVQPRAQPQGSTPPRVQM